MSPPGTMVAACPEDTPALLSVQPRAGTNVTSSEVSRWGLPPECRVCCESCPWASGRIVQQVKPSCRGIWPWSFRALGELANCLCSLSSPFLSYLFSGCAQQRERTRGKGQEPGLLPTGSPYPCSVCASSDKAVLPGDPDHIRYLTDYTHRPARSPLSGLLFCFLVLLLDFLSLLFNALTRHTKQLNFYIYISVYCTTINSFCLWLHT